MRHTSISIAILTAIAISACGGGGGSASTAAGSTGSAGATSSPSSASVATTGVIAASGTLQASATASTYVAGSLEQQFLAALNDVRQKAGAGVVDQSTLIDVASQAHGKYITANGDLTHIEDSTKPDFYAVSPADRVAKAGFSAGYVTEVIGGGFAIVNNAIVADGSICAMGLLNTVYHGPAMLSYATDIGVARSDDSVGEPGCVADLATLSSDTYGQVMASGAVIAYPYDGQTGVPASFETAGEIPHPPTSVWPNANIGSPVIVSLRNSDFINASANTSTPVTLSSLELHDAAGNIVPVGIIANALVAAGAGVTLTTDPLSTLPDGFVVMAPLSPLAAGATYTASVKASFTGGATASKTWSFTTAQAQ